MNEAKHTHKDHHRKKTVKDHVAHLVVIAVLLGGVLLIMRHEMREVYGRELGMLALIYKGAEVLGETLMDKLL